MSQNRDGPGAASYRLNTTAEFKPTHADHNSTKVAFVGWSETQHSDIYGLNDNYDDSILVRHGWMSLRRIRPSTPLWGYDTNGDGKPDRAG